LREKWRDQKQREEDTKKFGETRLERSHQ